MRAPAVALLVVGAMAVPQSIRAQTYDPDYPVCLRIYGPDNDIECRYTSMQQCALAASGRAAQCLVNPYPRAAIESGSPYGGRPRRGR